MKAYLAIKFHQDGSNKELIEQISKSLNDSDISCSCIAKEYENFGQVKFNSKELMTLTFEEIDKVDFLIVEFSEKGVGLGIEAGYAYSKGKPIIVIAKRGSEVSPTLMGIAKEFIFYEEIDGIGKEIRKLI